MSFFIPDPDDEGARYLIELESLVVGEFSFAEGLQTERELVEVVEGGRKFALARIGPYAEGHVTLTAGAADQAALFDWFSRCRDADAYVSARRNGDVIYMDGQDKERMRWRFRNAQITEWLGPGERPNPGEVYGIERLGISHEGLESIFPSEP
ncbi:MAG: phage tail protein [Planctomycetota bacterium]|jgi:phage tail-like protein